jgi:hypothetical protein
VSALRILAGVRAATAGMQTATIKRARKTSSKTFPFRSSDNGHGGANGEAKADITAKNLECLNEEIKVQEADAEVRDAQRRAPRPCARRSCAGKVPRGVPTLAHASRSGQGSMIADYAPDQPRRGAAH